MPHIKDIFEHAGDGACCIDRQQRIVCWNPAAERILGYRPDEAVGSYCWQLLCGQNLDGHQICTKNCATQQRMGQSEPVESFDIILRHKAGHRVLVNFTTLDVSPEDCRNIPCRLAHMWRIRENQAVISQQLRIHLLGPTLVIRPDGSTVDGLHWRRTKVRALFVYLVTRQGRPVCRDLLIETLWPDLSYRSALQNLNTTVYNLRRSLEPNLQRPKDSSFILYHNGHYSLDGSSIHWTDVRSLEDSIRQARLEPDTDRAIGLYQETTALYRGDYLADLVDTLVWSTNEEVRLQLLYLDALEELAGLYETQEQEQDAVDTYRRVLAIDCCRETSGRRLMRLLVTQGKRADAVATCQRLANALERELDLMLSDETRCLCEVIREVL